MLANNEPLCNAYDEKYGKTSTFNEAEADQVVDDYYGENTPEDWKRFGRYIAGIVSFFFILFKYLI